MGSEHYVEWFRNSAPYINAHRGQTFVIQFSGQAVTEPSFPNFIHDLALLDSLGVRMVIVHGARAQIEAAIDNEGLATKVVDGRRVTDLSTQQVVAKAVGKIRLEIEALLSMGLANSPMAGARIRVTSGNFVTAKPIGVRNGTDFGHTGEVRRVDVDSIAKHLDLGECVIVSPVGFSPTGEIFNLSAEDVATAVAVELRATKLILCSEDEMLTDERGQLIRQLTLEQAKNLSAERRHEPGGGENLTSTHLHNAVHACRNGVRRAHIVDRRQDGALIAELFTRDGIGTMVSSDQYDDTRRATIDDVGGILELIEPLEVEGTLVRRSREKLETEIERFLVMERDGTVIACAALYPLNEAGDMELACVAVHSDYQRAGRGENMLQDAERSARSSGGCRLFVLTTQATHWFREMGFEPGGVEDLPSQRQALYNFQRNSKVLVKALNT